MKHLYIVACPVYIALNCQFISNAWYQGWTQILSFYLILLISIWLLSDIAVAYIHRTAVLTARGNFGVIDKQ